MRISDWSSDVCSSDLANARPRDPEIDARTSPVPPLSEAFAANRPIVSGPCRRPIPVASASIVVPAGSSTVTKSSLPRLSVASPSRAREIELPLDPLIVALGPEAQRAREPSARHVERACEPARHDIERARRMRAADIERGDRDPALPARRQQDRTVARERPQPRLPLGGIIEPLRGGVEMPGHVLQPQRRI